MRATPLLLALLVAPFVLDWFPAAEQSTPEVVVEGTLSCAKCDLGKSKECVDAIETKKNAKSRTIFVASGERNDGCSSAACREGSREIRLTGIPFRKEGKRWIAPTRRDFVTPVVDQPTANECKGDSL